MELLKNQYRLIQVILRFFKTINHQAASGILIVLSKTSQAFSDIDKEKMPILMIANLRGFSGGTTDMFQEIIGAGIVKN